MLCFNSGKMFIRYFYYKALGQLDIRRFIPWQRHRRVCRQPEDIPRSPRSGWRESHCTTPRPASRLSGGPWEHSRHNRRREWLLESIYLNPLSTLNIFCFSLILAKPAGMLALETAGVTGVEDSSLATVHMPSLEQEEEEESLWSRAAIMMARRLPLE